MFVWLSRKVLYNKLFDCEKDKYFSILSYVSYFKNVILCKKFFFFTFYINDKLASFTINVKSEIINVHPNITKVLNSRGKKKSTHNRKKKKINLQTITSSQSFLFSLHCLTYEICIQFSLMFLFAIDITNNIINKQANNGIYNPFHTKTTLIK